MWKTSVILKKETGRKNKILCTTTAIIDLPVRVARVIVTEFSTENPYL